MIPRIREWGLRLLGLLGVGRRDEDLQEEIRAHLEMHAEDYERSGLTPEEARRQALLAFGGVDSVTERFRDQRSVPFIETTMQDIRFALRGFRRNPGFALAALVVLALGIGANAAIFTVVNTVLLKPLPYADPERLVMIWHVPPPASFPGVETFAVSPANYLDWKQQQSSFETMGLVRYLSFAMSSGGQPEQVVASGVSAGFFETMGRPPLHGRWFRADEDQPGRNQVVILGHRLWQNRFGGDPSIIGTTIRLDGKTYTVVGVMDATFRTPRSAQMWMPLGWNAEEWAVRSNHNASVVARLRPGVELPKAQAEMDAISKNLELAYPEDNKGWGAVVVSFRDELVGDVRPALLVLLGAVAFVLLISCSNVANLVLARTLARRKEIAVRLALGAGPRRIIRHVLTETTILAGAGALLGLLLAKGGVRLITAFFGERLPAMDIAADGRVIAFTAFVAVFTALAAGLAPGLRLARGNVSDAIKEGGGRGESDPDGGRLRAVLVITEVALSIVLLVGAGLMIRSLWGLSRVEAGFDARGVLTASVSLPETRYPAGEAQTRFFDSLLSRVRALPGVTSASIVTNLPMVNGNQWPVQIIGRAKLPISEQPQLQGNVMMPGYLKTMGISIVRGRDITEADRAGRPAVMLISEAAAQWLWPNENPIGQRLVLGFFPDAEREIVGIVRDVKERGLEAQGTASMYLPFAQLPAPYGSLVVKTDAKSPAVLAPSLTAALREIDREIPLVDTLPMEAIVADSTAQTRVTMYLLGSFAALAVLLAAVGIYSVLSYGVRRRMREIGIRMALGADSRGVVQMVVGQALTLTAIGVVLGLAGAVAIRNVMASLVYGVTPADPLTFSSVAALLLAVALLSAAFPAYRATKVDPITTLREG